MRRKVSIYASRNVNFQAKLRQQKKKKKRHADPPSFFNRRFSYVFFVKPVLCTCFTFSYFTGFRLLINA